ncbi:hypothetical protein AAH048_08700 [Parabacteroides merdae]|uniref:hypothetical protein n=1 Tax=Bacteroidales TaxID=171549 RepID=UPI0039B3A1CF
MITIIIIIVGFILGVWFLKKFDRIDCAFFAREGETYESFGGISILLCLAGGAIAGAVFVIGGMIAERQDWSDAAVLTGGLLAIAGWCHSVCQTILYIDGTGRRVGRVLFMFFTCVLCVLLGAAGSLLILLACLLMLLSGALKGAAEADKGKGYIVDKYGNKTKITSRARGVLGETYIKTSDGRSYRGDVGTDEVTRTD